MSPDPVGLLSQAITLSQGGRHQEALAAYDAVLALAPEHPDAWNNRGIALAQLREFPKALASFDRALAILPNFPEAWRNRGSALEESGDAAGALESFRRALQTKADFFDALLSQGRLLVRLGRPAEALRSLDRALTIQTGNARAHSQRALALKRLHRHEDAVAAFERSFSIASPLAIDLNEYGTTLIALRRFVPALAALDQALSLVPGFAEAINNRGLVLGRLLRHEEALACFERALAILPDYTGALDNRAIALAKLGRFDEAIASADEALKIEPNFAKAHVHQGITLLRMGNYELGFREYEWRWLDGAPPVWRNFRQPLWMGRNDLKGKSILVHAEQGLGDTLQFVRYVPLLAERGAKVLLAVPGVLLPLMRSLQGVERLHAWGEQVPESDFHCPLLSLPLACDTRLTSIPAKDPYLRVAPERAQAARARHAPNGEKLIGLCWRGNPLYIEDQERSLRLEDFVPLLNAKALRFVSLQQELTNEEQRIAERHTIVHPGGDFDSTCEVVAALDLVISVDTSWAHLAGALGKPVWILLAPVPHWVWLTGRKDSPWYPSARLFRQSAVNDWNPVVALVKRALAGFVRR